MGFHHIAREIWYNKTDDPTYFKICDGSGEDPDCSDSVVGDCIEDHLVYLGWSTDCNTDYKGPVSCAILNAIALENEDIFYDNFESIVANCGEQGFIKRV